MTSPSLQSEEQHQQLSQDTEPHHGQSSPAADAGGLQVLSQASPSPLPSSREEPPETLQDGRPAEGHTDSHPQHPSLLASGESPMPVADGSLHVPAGSDVGPEQLNSPPLSPVSLAPSPDPLPLSPVPATGATLEAPEANTESGLPGDKGMPDGSHTAQAASPTVHLQHDGDTPLASVEDDSQDAPVTQTDRHDSVGSAAPEEPIVRGFVPDEPLRVDPRLLRYCANDGAKPSPSPSLDIDVDSWVPEDFYRQPTGSTVAEPESVLGTSGRTYHGFKEGKYYLPNDGQEQDRLDFQHRALTILIGDKLHSAPVENPNYVMDIATGTGIWAMDFAQQYPQSNVIGVDLSKIQPQNAPPNVEFIKDDSEEPWVFPYKFDYVHARAVFTCFNDQKAVMKNAYDNLNPGGWIEYVDGSFLIACLDGTIEGTALKRWGDLLIKGGLALGRNLEVTKHFKTWLEEVGFVDVVERKLPWAYSPWPADSRIKLAGKFMQSNIYEGIRGISYVLLSGAGLTEQEINKLILDVRADLMNPTIHAFMPVWNVYGRKPFEHEMKVEQP